MVKEFATKALESHKFPPNLASYSYDHVKYLNFESNNYSEFVYIANQYVRSYKINLYYGTSSLLQTNLTIIGLIYPFRVLVACR